MFSFFKVKYIYVIRKFYRYIFPTIVSAVPINFARKAQQTVITTLGIEEFFFPQ
jgi:hypothetical protein